MDIREIIKRGGGPSKLARSLGLHHTSVLGWQRVPAGRVKRVSELTGVPLYEIRPELWEKPANAKADA